MLKRLVIFLIFCGFIACNGEAPPPAPPPTTTTTIPEPPSPPEIPPRRTAPFTWNLARGFSLFSGSSAEGPMVIDLFDEVHREWPHLWPTARVCAERMNWPEGHDYLYRGPTAEPFDQTSPAWEGTKAFLDWAAGAVHAQVLLVPVCTLKDFDGNWTEEDVTSGRVFDVHEKWVRHVCRLANDYENVAIEVINEWRHPNSVYAKFGLRQDQVNRMIRACRQEAPRKQIGTDSNVNARRIDYDDAIQPNVDFLSYHPWRNPDPDEDEMRIMVREALPNKAAVFSETTCYDVGAPARGNCTGDWEQILAYQRDAERKGAVFFYHSKYLGLCWPREDCMEKLEPITPRGNHPIRHGR